MRFRAIGPLFFVVLLLAGNASLGDAEDFYCEVMAVKGHVTLSNQRAQDQPLEAGDLLQIGDIVRTFEDSRADLAFDKAWLNVTRIGPHTKVTLESLSPTNLKLEHGNIFARLKALPKKETFEIKTPLAIAVVRGSVYEVTHEGGQTTVTNHGDSPVTVYFLDENGNITGSVVLEAGESTTLEGIVSEEAFLFVPEGGTPPDLDRYPDGKVMEPPVEPCFPNCPDGTTGGEQGSEEPR